MHLFYYSYYCDICYVSLIKVMAMLADASLIKMVDARDRSFEIPDVKRNIL